MNGIFLPRMENNSNSLKVLREVDQHLRKILE